MNLFLRHFLFLFLIFAPTLSYAQLKWDKQIQEVPYSYKDTSVTAHYTFQNIGKGPITIGPITTSCECITASVAKNTYQPGEKGDMTVILHLASHVPIQEKEVYVSIPDNPGQSVVLQLKAIIPDAIKISPTELVWKLHGKARPRIIHVTLINDQPVKILGVRTTDPIFSPKLKVMQGGTEYQVIVTPTNTSNPARAEIYILTDFSPQSAIRLSAIIQ